MEITNKDKTKGVISIVLKEKEIDNLERGYIEFIPSPGGAFLRFAPRQQLELYNKLVLDES